MMSQSQTLSHGLQCHHFMMLWRGFLIVGALLVFTFSCATSAPVSSVLPVSLSDIRNTEPQHDSTLLGLQGEWVDWKGRHNKDYKTLEEELRRFAVWMDNYVYIKEHNEKSEMFGYTLGMNVFGDQTFQDWSDIYSCHKPNSGDYDTELYSSFVYGGSLEEYVDWRDKGVVTEVKNQEDYRCHSCYAFAATGALESAYALSTRNLVSLSEQQILDCSKVYANAACQGGNYLSTWEYIIKNGGIDTSSYYPYKSEAGFCEYNSEFIGATMKGIKVIERENEDALAEAVQTVGPVTVAIDHLHRRFQFYREGIYSESSCRTSPKNATHEMVAIGFGTDSNYGAYWILKNSYGTTWGEDGYMLMLRGANTCGVASDAGFPVV